MTALIRKLLTRPVWWYERLAPRGSLSLPDSEAGQRLDVDEGISFLVLSTPDTILEAGWTVWSVARVLQLGFRARIVCDGPVPPAQRAHLQSVLPGLNILTVSEVLDPCLLRHSITQSFHDVHPLGRKLLLILSAQLQGPTLYADNDLLFFNPGEELRSCILAGERITYLQEGKGNSCYDDPLQHRLQEAGHSLIPSLNSGLLFLPHQAFPFDRILSLLSHWDGRFTSWFSEQTLLAALVASHPSIPLSSDRYVVNDQRQFFLDPDVNYSEIACRHFTGTVRHLLYRKGIPFLRKQAALQAKPAA